MTDHPFNVASVSATAQPYHTGNRAEAPPPHRNRTRKKLLIFLSVFLVMAGAGLSYSFMRPAIYQSYATIQLVPVNPRNEAEGESLFAQQVPAQRQALMSRDLISQVLDRILKNSGSDKSAPLDLPAIQQMLQVIPFENSTILKLRAEGSEPNILPEIIHIWLELYLGRQAFIQQTDSNNATEAILHQLGELEKKLTVKREELTSFRERYDIVSMKREENQILSKLNSANAALNKAGETRVLEEANLSAIREAIKQGKWAGKYKKQPELVRLEQEADILRERIKDLEQRYTPKFMEMDKDAKAILRNLSALEEKIQLAYEENRKAAIEGTQQAIDSARRAENELENQLIEDKKKASTFSGRFSEYASLQEAVSQLEALQRNLQEQLVAMQIQQTPETFQIKVLERAFTPERPDRPDYPRDAGISVALACLLGIVAVLCYELFTRPIRESGGGDSHTTYNQIFPNAYPVLPDPEHLHPKEKMLPGIAPPLPRELSKSEVKSLLDAADEETKPAVFALLSGVCPEEIVGLKWSMVTLESHELLLAGENSRRIYLSELFRSVLTQKIPDPMTHDQSVFRDKNGAQLSTAALDALITAAAKNAGIIYHLQITSTVLRHTYIAHLVRMGACLQDIATRVGPLPLEHQAIYSFMAPPGSGIALKDIDWVYPVLYK